MKTKEGFMLRQLGEQYVVVALGKASEEFHGMIRLNIAGAYLWEKLSKENMTKEQLTEAVLEKYDVEEETAGKDVEAFIAKIQNAGLLEE